MQALEQVLQTISDTVWGWPMIILLFGTHLFLTVRLKFIQRFIGRAIRLSLRRSREGVGDISQFGAMTTALAATIGTGNIVGVATAIAAGGPGAVFWMWLTGVFGIATKYGEAVLSVKYRVVRSRDRATRGCMAAGRSSARRESWPGATWRPTWTSRAVVTGYAVADLRELDGYDWRLSERNVWKVERWLIDYPHRPLPMPEARYRRALERYQRFRPLSGEPPGVLRRTRELDVMSGEALLGSG